MKKSIFALIILNIALIQCKQKEHAADADYKDDTVVSAEDPVAVEKDFNDELSGGTRSDDLEALAFIKAFYEDYLAGLDNSTADAVTTKYCTSDLTERLYNSDMDYDPFLNAQDYDESFLKTLEVEALREEQGRYVVSHEDDYSHERISVIISLAKFNGGYKITDVTNER